MKFLAYVRGSTDDVDVRNQLYAIRKWAEENGHEIVKVFPDKGVSGWKVPPKERPHFKEMLEYSKETGIKNVVVYSVDRLSRHFWDGMDIIKFLRDSDFYIEFTNDPWFTQMPPDIRDLMLAVMLWTAEQYAKSVGLKTTTMIERVKSEADKLNIFDTGWGQGKLYRKDGQLSSRRRVTPRVIDQVAQLRHRGYSWRAIADKLGFENKTTLYNAWRRLGQRVKALREEGYTYKEIAEHSDLSIWTVKQLVGGGKGVSDK